MVTARHFVVRGRVQGVGFRWSTAAVAGRLGVAGWVRNLPDGSVEVWAEADAGRIEALADWLRQGPGGARVSEVVSEAAVPAGVAGFEIRA
jgi:acylphosphatase